MKERHHAKNFTLYLYTIFYFLNLSYFFIFFFNGDSRDAPGTHNPFPLSRSTLAFPTFHPFPLFPLIFFSISLFVSL